MYEKSKEVKKLNLINYGSSSNFANEAPNKYLNISKLNLEENEVNKTLSSISILENIAPMALKDFPRKPKN